MGRDNVPSGVGCSNSHQGTGQGVCIVLRSCLPAMVPPVSFKCVSGEWAVRDFFKVIGNKTVRGNPGKRFPELFFLAALGGRMVLRWDLLHPSRGRVHPLVTVLDDDVDTLVEATERALRVWDWRR